MGVDKKTTLMVIRVDLQCSRCYKKIKRVLCRIPQIQDQVYNEKENFVIIKVVCCSPEKIKQKIICKGGCAVKSIEIKEAEKQKEAEKPKNPKEPEKLKNPENPKDKPPPQPQCPPPCPPQLAYPVPFGTCCRECYEGRSGGPCYDGYYGRPIYDSYGGGGGYGSSYAGRCDYFSEENSSGCSIM
ncbi:hypothetical protein ACB092_05G212500 [Castanea dentata]